MESDPEGLGLEGSKKEEVDWPWSPVLSCGLLEKKLSRFGAQERKAGEGRERNIHHWVPK